MDQAALQERSGNGWPSGLPESGQILAGSYRVDSVIGSGGMALVLAAHDLRRNRPVAVKIMRPKRRNNPELLRRFVREARMTRALGGPHVARLFDSGQLDDGTPFLVMERLEGVSLRDLVRREGPLPTERAVDCIMQACEGVAEAHARGLVHRDLKPANLFWARSSDGTHVVKVLDFGIAKQLVERDDTSTGASSLTATGDAIGSPATMSPEQCRSSKRVDYRTDLWSLGVCLHMLLTDKKPFAGADIAELLTNVVAGAPATLRAHRPDAPQALEAVIQRCLRKDREQRFQSVAELAEALVPHGPAGCEQRAARIAHILASNRRGPPEHEAGRGPEAHGQDDETTRSTVRFQRTLLDGGDLDGDERGSTVPLARTTRPVLPVGELPIRSTLRDRAGAVVVVLALGGISALAVAAWALRETASSPGVAEADTSAGATAASSERGTRASVDENGESATEALVLIDLAIEPAEATVQVDGEAVPTTELAMPRDGAEHHLVVSAEGYLDDHRTFVATSDTRITVSLSPDPAASPATDPRGTAPNHAAAGGRHRPRRSASPSDGTGSDLLGPMESSL